MAVRILKCMGLMALLASLGACARGMPDPAAWLSTYPKMCLPGWHAVSNDKGGYECAPNAN